MRCFDCPRGCGAEREVRRAVEQRGEPRVRILVADGGSTDCDILAIRAFERAPAEKHGGHRAQARFFVRERLDGFGNARKPAAAAKPDLAAVLSAIERALALAEKPNRIIYNTSGYETADGTRRAAAFTDVFLADFKYADGALAQRLSGAPDYFAQRARNIIEYAQRILHAARQHQVPHDKPAR